VHARCLAALMRRDLSTAAMPSKNSLYYISPSIKPAPTTHCDLNDLVYQIKEKLKVNTINPSSNQLSFRKEKKSRLRASPYSVPRSKCGACEGRRCLHQRCFPLDQRRADDPYAALQELLRDGDLIKEAVRRLNYECFSDSKRKSFIYDSDDERTDFPFKVEL